MARVAFCLHMAATQRKAGALMIEMRLLPLFLIVTTLAFLAITAIMNVLNPVTAHAGCRERLVGFANVACRASDVLVRFPQREFCFPVIIRLEGAPVRRGMARLAVL